MVEWQDGTKVSDAYVDSNNNIVPAVYSGNTPLSAYNLNKMQQLIDVYRNNYITAKTVEGAGKIRKIFGNLSQKTSTQGKNLCPTNLSEWESGHYNNVGVKENNAYRIRLKKLLRVTPNTVYYVTTNATSYRIIIRLYDSTGVFLSSLGSVNNATTFTTTIDTYYISISIWNASGGETSESYSNYETLFNNTIKPFICLNSETDKTYEEFTPNMPSPDYPAEIEVAGDNINLFDKTAVSPNKGISYSNGTEYSNNTVFSTDYIDIKGIDNICWNGASDLNNSTWGTLYDASKNYLSGVNVSTKKYEITNSNAKYIRLTFLNEYLDNLKIEKGTKSTGYTQYGYGGIDYKTCNKNMLILKDGTYTNNGITAVVKDGIITLNGTATDTSFVIVNLKKEYVSKANTYHVLKANIEETIGDSSNYSALRLNDDGTKQVTFNNINSYYVQMNTADLTVTKIVIRTAKNLKYSNFVIKPQFELGQTATDWIEGKSEQTTLQLPQNEFLAKIGDYQDYIDENGTIHKIIKKIVLNGTENWGINSVNNTVNRFSIAVSDINNNTNNANKIVTVCNYFKGVTHNDRNNIDNSIFSICNGSSRILSINTSAFSAVNNFKSFLANQYANGTPVEVYYLLAEEYTTSCNFSNIIAQYADETNLSCNTEVESEFTQSDGIATVLKSMGIIQKKILEQEAE